MRRIQNRYLLVTQYESFTWKQERGISWSDDNQGLQPNLSSWGRQSLEHVEPSPSSSHQGQIGKTTSCALELLGVTSAPDMYSPYEKAFFAILLLEATIGLLSSFFIIVYLTVKEFRKKNIGSYSKILIPLNMSNICYSITLSVNFNIHFMRPELFNKVSVYYTITYMTLYSVTSYMWISAVLCIFYFMKIVSSQPGVLTMLKSQIGTVVWWLIITSEVVSFGGSFLSMLLHPETNQRNSSITLSEVSSDTSVLEAFVTYVMILNCLPFLVIIMATIGSTGFLKLYNHQIEKNMKTSGNTRVRDYRVAIQTMIGLLTLYTILLLCNILIILGVFSHQTLGYRLSVIFLFSCATLLPALLIYGNTKLKEAMKQMITCQTTPQGSGQQNACDRE